MGKASSPLIAAVVLCYPLHTYGTGSVDLSTKFHFSDFFIETEEETSVNAKIYHAECTEYARFHKNLLHTHENVVPQTCQFLQRNVCQGKPSI